MTINTPNRALIAREIALEILELHTRDEIEQFVWPEEASGDTIDRAYSRTDRIVALLDAARAEGPVQEKPEWVGVFRYSDGQAATPPADEVGRALERLTQYVPFLNGDARRSPYGKQTHAFKAKDLSLILSHVSRLEEGRAWQQRQINDTENRAETAEASLKLAVEALEDCESTLEAVRDIPPNEATRMLVDASINKARTICSRGDKGSLRHEDMPLAPGGDVEASRQSGGAL